MTQRYDWAGPEEGFWFGHDVPGFGWVIANATGYEHGGREIVFAIKSAIGSEGELKLANIIINGRSLHSILVDKAQDIIDRMQLPHVPSNFLANPCGVPIWLGAYRPY